MAKWWLLWNAAGLAAAMAVCGCASAPKTASAPRPVPPAGSAAAGKQSHTAEAAVLAEGFRLEREGKLAAAKDMYLYVVRMQPNHGEALHRLAVVCTRRNESAAAAEYYERALKADPQNVALLTDAGYFRYLLKDYGTALSLLQRAASLAPENPRAVNNLALVLGARGQTDEAYAWLQKVNTPAVAMQALAKMYHERGEDELALESFQKAQALDKSIPIPDELIARLPAPATVAEPPAVANENAKLVARPLPARKATTEAVDEIDSIFAESPVELTASSVPKAHPIVTPTPESVSGHPLQDAEVDDGFEMPEVATSSIAAAPLRSDDFGAPFSAGATGTLHQPSEDSLVEEAPLVADEQPAVPALPPEFTLTYGAAEQAVAVDSEQADARWSQPPAESTVAVREPADPAHGPADAGLQRFCPVTLRDENRLEDGLAEFAVEYRGQFYEMASAEALRKFRDDPEAYTPVAGGLDVVAVHHAGEVTEGSLQFAVWFKKRLYLFTDDQHRTQFRLEPERYVQVQ